MSAEEETSSTAVKKEDDAVVEEERTGADEEDPDEEDPTAYNTTEDTDEYKRSFALNYALRRKPRCLFAMAIGFPEFQGILDKPPLSTIKRKELNDQYIPKAEDFKMEIKRRSHFFMNSKDEAKFYTEDLKRGHPLKTKRSSIVLPQPNQWLNTQLKAWLMERPMKPDDNDTKFIRFQVKRALDYLATEGADTSPEVLRELPVLPTPVDTEAEISTSTDGEPSAATTTPVPLPPPVTAENLATPQSSSVTPSPEDFDTEEFMYSSEADTTEYKLSASENFLLKGGKPRILFVLALGMPEFQGMLESATYNVVKRKEVTEDYMPRAEDYRFEIKRRAHYFMNAEDQISYYLQDLKTKNPLENLRGIVTLPQPAQWKLNALKSWLLERPLKPDPKDVAFLKGAITKCMDVLTDAVTKDPTLTQSVPVKRSSGIMMMGGNVPFMSPLGVGTQASATLMEVISKQDAILGVVAKQTRQQTILNKITILTQSTMGYQQEISSLRSTLNDIENRILTVEMKIAENPSAEENLKTVMAKQEERVKGVKDQIKELEEKVVGLRADIETHNSELKEIDEEEIIIPSPFKRLKLEEPTETENNEVLADKEQGEEDGEQEGEKESATV